VVDIDGVVADVRHRLHHLERRYKDWHAFFSAADRDPPHPEGLAVVRRCLAEGLTVHWLTGRPEFMRSLTEDWLRSHDLPDAPLTMRPLYNREPARLLKRERVSALSERAEIRVVIDDDSEVVLALRKAGYPVMHAQWAPRERWHGSDVLTQIQEGEGRT
jgi:hypothetical protein